MKFFSCILKTLALNVITWCSWFTVWPVKEHSDPNCCRWLQSFEPNRKQLKIKCFVFLLPFSTKHPPTVKPLKIEASYCGKGIFNTLLQYYFRPGWDKYQNRWIALFGCGWFRSSVLCIISLKSPWWVLSQMLLLSFYCSPQSGCKAVPSLLKRRVNNIAWKDKCLVLSLPIAVWLYS